MLKTYTLLKKEHTQTSEKHGTMTFLLRDENGDERPVTGDTFLDENKKPVGISSSNKRELPLIEDMLHLDIGETVEIEFDAYNHAYNRELDKTVNQIAYDKVMEMQKERKLFYRVKKFFGITNSETKIEEKKDKVA
ncbi:MAG: hypothetical protein V3V19_05170 [Cocleimonas sp.]